MRFEIARDRLRHVPAALPSGPRSLDPVTVPVEGRPSWVGPAASRPPRDAAVLVLLYPGSDGLAHVVLTERPIGDLRHSGQISFPGGAMDPGDDFPIGTALREAAEEVALDVDEAGVEPLGLLGTVDMRGVSGFIVVPVVAVAAREPVLVPHQREVASILRVPAAAFLPAAPIQIVEDERDGYRLRYGAYHFEGHVIWGATARILGQLGAILGDA
ncbi:MAG: CoA pyrophosphatase [Candidatus Limnocylindrales bacterium]